MYQPGHGRFRVDDPAALLAELSETVPATLVTRGPEGFRTTILPMLFDPADGPHGTLRGHMARGNPHWREIEAAEASAAGPTALAIFAWPEAYVSPAWYEEKRTTGKVVPTWNYVAAQAEGTITLRHEPEWLVPHVARLVERHEAHREEPWALSDAPADYVASQAKAIVGLELRITRLEGKSKLSQNRSDADVDGAIAGLAAGSGREQAVAHVMRAVRARTRPAEPR
jgi:transcriptional regulator